jgi:hypothetical protein
MIIILSVLTAVKDYVEIVHKLIETDSSNFNTDSIIATYSNFGAITTYIILFIKNAMTDFISLNWIQSLGSLPIIIPQIASAMISEISVLDGYFHNAFVFLETPLSYGNNSLIFYCLEKFTIGIINSLFLFLPTSAAHLICLRRFVMQGIEAGYFASLGTIAGNIVWIGSITFGLRCIIVPWLSLDLLRCILGFILLIKYMWDSYSEKRVVLEDLSKKKIFLLNFLLAFTEQTNIYPFISNTSISSDSTILESFPVTTFVEFCAIHSSYLLGIFLGSFSLLQLTCWFWENPAFNFYMWMVSSFKITTSFYSKVFNFLFLYLTMICTISSFSYFALDYTVTNPIGFVHQDRLMDQKGLLETAFINSKASDRNTRRNRGRHGRRERWKRRVRRYRTFDASLYDQGIYDLFTIEDLNYGFDRFWLRRKMRNHRVHFRFFPGPWMRSFKKQLSRPRLESFMGPRVEFFRILFEQVYHPEFHAFNTTNSKKTKQKVLPQNNNNLLKQIVAFHGSIYSNKRKKIQKHGFIQENSALRKFVRKANTRINSSKIVQVLDNDQIVPSLNSLYMNTEKSMRPLYSKRWKSLFSNISHQSIDSKLRQEQNLFQYLYKNILFKKSLTQNTASINNEKRNSLNKLSKKERQILRYKTFLSQPTINKIDKTKINHSIHISNDTPIKNFKKTSTPREDNTNPINSIQIETFSSLEKKSHVNINTNSDLSNKIYESKNSLFQKTTKDSDFEFESYKPLTLFHPIKFYLKTEHAFQQKLKFYGANIYRTFGIENNAPYFRTMMRRFFYYYKPTLRWERTMRTATMRKARRKGPRIIRKQNLNKKTTAISKSFSSANVTTNASVIMNENIFASVDTLEKANILSTKLQKPNHFYSLIGKRASRYRYQIYKDVLQHWYYSPLNRFLLKLDVDNFIRRQPNSYFLTKKEEQLLHLRRFLLSEYYQTLRWYTYMQHYSSMKKHIGGTKSFASGIYSQQFMGTFKKVRHLFALTPGFSENNILKFDQPLYNEYSNSNNNSILTNSLFHEELLGDEDLFISKSQNVKPFFNTGNDLTNQSTQIIREYLIKAAPLREKIIQGFLKEKNYSELTQFLFKGQKMRGSVPLSSERRFLAQEKEHLYTPEEKTLSEQTKQQQINNFFKNKTNNIYKTKQEILEQNKNILNASTFQQNMWIKLLKKCQICLYDQESLKNYLLHHVDKRKKQQQRQEKYLKYRLVRLKNWFVQSSAFDAFVNTNAFDGFVNTKNMKNTTNMKNTNANVNTTNRIHQIDKNSDAVQLNGVTTAIQKAIKEGIFIQKDIVYSSIKSNIRNNLPKIENISNHLYSDVKEHLIARRKIKQLQIIKIEKDVNKLLTTVLKKEMNPTSILNYSLSENKNSNVEKSVYTNTKTNSNISFKKRSLSFIYKTIIPFKYLYSLSSNIFVSKPLTLIQQFLPSKLLKSSAIVTTNAIDGVDGLNTFNNNWRKQEIALTKRKKTRKTFKRLRNTNQLEISKDLEMDEINELLKYRQNKKPNIRKETVPLRQKQDIERDAKMSTNISLDQLINKSIFIDTFAERENKRHIKSWKGWIDENRKKESSIVSSSNQNFIDRFKNILNFKQFKKKRSRLRRYRRLKSRGPIKKRTLGEKLKRQFKLLKRYSRNSDSTSQLQSTKDSKYIDIFQMITKRKYEPKSVFLMKETKQRRTRLIKRRFWRKHKKQKYHQTKRKQRKRRRYAVGKIRNMFKEYKRIKGNMLIKQWWWDNFLPNLKANFSSLITLETEKDIKTKLNNLSSSEILARDEKNSNDVVFKKHKDNMNLNILHKDLQIGDKDYKPLAIPQALRIREDLINQGVLNFNNHSKSQKDKIKNEIEKMEQNKSVITIAQKKYMTESDFPFLYNDMIGKVTQNLLTKKSLISSQLEELTDLTIDNKEKISIYSPQYSSQYLSTKSNQSTFLINTNPVPFYAGWDETLRKFVITNRLLSTKKIKINDFNKNNIISESLKTSPFYNLPLNGFLKGMNAATTLYWQIPFTTYDPDQFFVLGMDGFSPIGWRKFHFRYSKETTKPILVKTKTQVFPSKFYALSNQQTRINTNPELSTEENQFFDLTNLSLSYNLQHKILTNLRNKQENTLYRDTIKNDLNLLKKNNLRRSQKRYKRVKKHPRPPVWFPSGPLTNQVLPVHYIYVFYKRSRLPRDRYIRRRLRQNLSIKLDVLNNIKKSFTQYTDFTLRKRVKPRRQYHRKRSKITDNFILKRRAFRESFSSFKEDQQERQRPVPANFITIQSGKSGESSAVVTTKNAYSKQRQKAKEKQSSENVRIRQLRRRIQRQVIRPVWRYRPRAGGYTWPGDYLRLELVKAPLLQEVSKMKIISNEPGSLQNTLYKNEEKSVKSRKTRKKKRKINREWQIQPKKYLLHKHNLKVLKKRLEKSQNSYKRFQRSKELSYFLHE